MILDATFYDPDHSSYEGDFEDEVKFEHLGTIKVRDVNWSMSVNGELFFKFVPTNLTWLDRLLQNHHDLHASEIMLLVDSTSIAVNDMFDVYITRDTTIFQHYEQMFNNEGLADMSYLLLRLRSRVYTCDKNKIVDIRYKPKTCPMCGADICKVLCTDENDEDKVYWTYVCTNPHCTVYAYRDIHRFLLFALHMRGYHNFIRRLTSARVLTDIVDLWNNKTRMRLYDFADRRYVSEFISKIDSKTGKISLSEYLACLPTHTPMLLLEPRPVTGLEYWLYKPTVDKDFGRDPKEFSCFVYDQFENFCDNDYSHWLPTNAPIINKYMSLVLFFEYAELYNIVKFNDYMDQLTALSKLHVFTN